MILYYLKITQYNGVNSQFDKQKLALINDIRVTTNLLSNKIGNFNDETNLPNELLLTDRQVRRLHKFFVNNSSANNSVGRISC